MESSQKTLSTVISSKLADLIDVIPAKTFLKLFTGSLIIGLLSAAVSDIQLTVTLLHHVAHWHGSAPVKVAAVALLVFNRQRIILLTKKMWARRQPEVETVEGIPVTEVIDHLFQHSSMKVKETTQKFRVPQYRVEALVKNLKRVGVLLADEQTYTSIINPEFSRQDVASILAGCEKASDLQPLFRRDELGFTSSPSAAEIRTRVEDAITPPPPAFVTRKLTMA